MSVRHVLFSASRAFAFFWTISTLFAQTGQVPATNLTEAVWVSPIAEFRSWLALTPAEREQVLAQRPARQRDAIQAKLREYDSLSAPDRERRLRTTELRWYLPPLMSMPMSNRNARVALIPAPDRKFVEDRLQQWDLLPPEVRQDVLRNETAINYFLRVDPASVAKTETPALPLKPSPRTRQAPSAPTPQQALSSQVQEFLDLSPREKEKTLQSFSDIERLEMEKTLQAFARLSPEERNRCIESFGKFATMTRAQQLQFLKSAERWQAMSLEDRAAWRNLVNALPPLPPVIEAPPIPDSVGKRNNMPAPQ